MKFAVYEIRNANTGKRYIGSSTNVKRREKYHFYQLKRGNHGCNKLQASWIKHGAEAFCFKVIAWAKNHLEMVELEQFLIDENDSVRQGYNINPVAAHIGGLPKTAEHRRKIGEAHRGKLHTEETKAKIRTAIIARGPIQRTPESYARAAIKLRGQTRSAEFREKMKQIALARPKPAPRSLAYRQACAERRRGTKLINGKYVKVTENA